MEVEEVLQLSGKAVKTQISEKSWNDTKLLIMTQDQDKFCIWSLTNQLQLNRLLQESSELDHRSFFSFVEVGGQTLESESQQATQTALLCSSGSFYSSQRSLSLHTQKSEESN